MTESPAGGYVRRILPVTASPHDLPGLGARGEWRQPRAAVTPAGVPQFREALLDG